MVTPTDYIQDYMTERAPVLAHDRQQSSEPAELGVRIDTRTRWCLGLLDRDRLESSRRDLPCLRTHCGSVSHHRAQHPTSQRSGVLAVVFLGASVLARDDTQ